MTVEGERQGPPHDESIMDPEHAHYVANQEKPFKDKELHERDVKVIREEVETTVRKMTDGYTSETPQSTRASDVSTKAYELAQRFSFTSLTEANQDFRQGCPVHERQIIEEAVKIAYQKQEGQEQA